MLMWLISKYTDSTNTPEIDKMSNSDWKIVASLISGISLEACMFRWLSLKKTKLATNSWT